MKTSDAARLLGLHPADLVARAYRMTGSLEDVWPSIDDGLVESIRQLELGPAPPQRAKAFTRTDRSGKEDQPLRVSESAARVLDKLERQSRWGSNHVNLDTLRNHFCKGISGVDEAIEELLGLGLLLSEGNKKGPFSLDTHRKGEIDVIVGRLRQGRPSTST